MAATENKFNKLQDDVKKLCLSDEEGSKSALVDIKKELEELKYRVFEDKEAYSSMARTFGETVSLQIQKVEELRAKETEERLKKETESDLDQAKDMLELERNKVDDCQREIEIYRQQLEHSTREMDLMKSELIEEKEKFEKILNKEVESRDKEKKEAIKKLMLEHEVELESVRQALETSDKVIGYQEQIASLECRLGENVKYTDDLKKKTHILEKIQEEKFHTEKDKIVQILEAGFAQREKLAIQQAEESLAVIHAKEIESRVKEQQTKGEDEREVLR